MRDSIHDNFHPHPRPGPMFSVSITKETDDEHGEYQVRRSGAVGGGMELIIEGSLEFGDARLTSWDVMYVVAHVCADTDELDPNEAEALFEQAYREIGEVTGF